MVDACAGHQYTQSLLSRGTVQEDSMLAMLLHFQCEDALVLGCALVVLLERTLWCSWRVSFLSKRPPVVWCQYYSVFISCKL